MTSETAVDRAEDAIAAGDWAAAFALLADAAEETPPDLLDLLARAAYGAGEFEAALTAWERLHAHRQRVGDHLGAADVAATIAMYLMMDTGLMAPVRGWLARADRLLLDQPEQPTHAVVAMTRTYERLISGDQESAARWARQAVEVGTRQDVPVATTLGRVAWARMLIFAGQVDEGLRLLDEAAVATVSGELDPLATGMVYCELICAMQGLAQYDRAQEWTDAFSRWRPGNAIGGIAGRCRVHRAEMLRLRGSCAEAEDEALHACEELRPWMRREYGWPLSELGTIRLRRGDLEGAERAFLDAHAHGWDPHPGLALVRLAQGEVGAAAGLIREALERPRNEPSKERPPHTALRRAPLLEAQVEIAVAAGDLDTARAAADELVTIAETFRSTALHAGAVLAQSRVALLADDPAAAVHHGEQALAGWSEVQAPYEVAVTRLVIAEAHDRCGHREPADLERQAALAAFERIGAAAPPAVDSPAPVDVPPQAGVFRCDGDTRTVGFDGHTVLLQDLKGMRYLERLLAAPSREFHALDLVAGEHGARAAGATADELPASDGGDAGPILDDTAREAYRRRLREVEEDIEDATRLGDLERVALARADRDFLVAELSRAFGLGGRGRRAAATSERARASVTRALRYALARIREHHPELADHLDVTVRTGTYCAYEPDPRVPITWHT